MHPPLAALAPPSLRCAARKGLDDAGGKIVVLGLFEKGLIEYGAGCDDAYHCPIDDAFGVGFGGGLLGDGDFEAGCD